MTESELLKKLQTGDEATFEIIFKKYFVDLCLFAEHFLKDTNAAEDIVEEYFCDLWENAQFLEIKSSLRGYLFRSVYYRCLKYIRHQKVEQKYLENHYPYSDKEILESASNDYPVINLIAKELENRISIVIDALPAQCKKIFCLNRFENLSYAEIAKKLDISQNTVKTQMARALQKLKTELNDYLILLILFFAISAYYFQ